VFSGGRAFGPCLSQDQTDFDDFDDFIFFIEEMPMVLLKVYDDGIVSCYNNKNIIKIIKISLILNKTTSAGIISRGCSA